MEMMMFLTLSRNKVNFREFFFTTIPHILLDNQNIMFSTRLVRRAHYLRAIHDGLNGVSDIAKLLICLVGYLSVTKTIIFRYPNEKPGNKGILFQGIRTASTEIRHSVGKSDN